MFKIKDEEFLDITECMKIIGFKYRGTIYKAIRTGKLKANIVGRKYIISKTELSNYVKGINKP